METRGTTGQSVYEDFVPSYKLVRDEGIDTLVVELSEFKKDQVRFLVENFGNLNISGERPLGGNRWSRFRNIFEVPKETTEIRARFENGRLYVKVLPKLSTEATMEAAIKIKANGSKDQPTKVQNIEVSQNQTRGPKPSTREDGKERFEIRETGLGLSKPMQVLVNIVVAVVVLVVMALYLTSKN